jgi:hypothetical protein
MTKRLHRPLSIVAAAVVLSTLRPSSVAWPGEQGATAPTQVTFERGFPKTTKRSIYPLGDVKVGDRGVGYTVFTGDTVKPFDVEVLGILRGMLGPHQDVILARLSGPEIEFSGVVAGMSGSPVYFDGRLAGAVSYRFGAFTKEPIAGITPIESMLAIYGDDELAPRRDKRRVASGPPIPYTRTREVRAPIPVPPRPVFSGPYDPKPIDTPIFLSGFGAAAADELKARFEEAGLFAVVGGGGGGEAMLSPRATGKIHPNEPAQAGGGKAAPILPGAPIAAILMRGDLNVAGTGTVTFIEDNTVLAFGHPFFGYGHVEFPMATASILNTLASLAGSYKQSATAVEVGAIVHDRLTAIAGSLGKVAPMIPVKIEVRPDRASRKPIRTEVEIVDHDIWMPVMLASAVGSSASGRVAEEAGGTMDLVARFKIGDRTLELKDTYSTTPPLRPAALAAQDVASLVAIVSRNALSDAAISGIEVEMKTRPEIELAWLEQVTPEKTEVRPGEPVRFNARLRSYREAPVNVAIELIVPSDADGEIDAVIGGAVELDRRDFDAIGDRVPEDLDDLLGILSDRRPGRGLYGRLYSKRPGLRSNAEILSSLPLSQRLMIAEPAGIRHRAITEAPGPSTSVAFPGVVIGSTTIKLRVIR